ncbi:hypothetical protein AVEN_161231-1 [Araneus ventricosus]|uniref:Uncharacterized protein n=1 Tax=Araneus ventricosus TaxID=182803 RepID=A0A4Y2QP34_ARAVE|nr:hypothetical protein AVEN_161231-1 [Araneus ventricosus]
MRQASPMYILICYIRGSQTFLPRVPLVFLFTCTPYFHIPPPTTRLYKEAFVNNVNGLEYPQRTVKSTDSKLGHSIPHKYYAYLLTATIPFGCCVPLQKKGGRVAICKQKGSSPFPLGEEKFKGVEAIRQSCPLPQHWTVGKHSPRRVTAHRRYWPKVAGEEGPRAELGCGLRGPARRVRRRLGQSDGTSAGSRI